MELKPQTSDLNPQDLSDETLDRLLAVGHEDKKLDFKRVLDLSREGGRKQKDKVELAKDVSAMSVVGGCIIIGADDQGRPTGDMNNVSTVPFDQANLSTAMESLLDGPRLSSKIFKRGGHTLVAVLVHQSDYGCCFCEKEGAYHEPSGTKVCVFREGDAFYRDGTKSARLGRDGLEEVLQRRVADAKSSWRAERRAEADEALIPAIDRLEGRLLAGIEKLVLRRPENCSRVDAEREPAPETKAEPAPETKAAAPTLSDLEHLDFKTSDPSDVAKAALATIRTNDAVGFQVAIEEALRQARQLIDAGEIEDGLGSLLDRLICAGAICIRYDGLETWLDRVIDALTDIYSMPLGEGDAERFAYNTSISPDEKGPRVWFQIVHRVFALGGLALRREKWGIVAKLTLQRPDKLIDYDKNWLRHALTMSSRAELLKAYGGANLISLAVEDTLRLECLLGTDAPDREELLTSSAGFDVLYNVTAVGDAKDVDHGGVFYPSFSGLRSGRVFGIVERLLDDQEMRSALFPLGDDDLATALAGIGHRARSEGWSVDGFRGWSAPINSFIEEHFPAED